MKRLQLFVFHTQKKRTLYGLQQTGLVDINLQTAAGTLRDMPPELMSAYATLAAVENAASSAQAAQAGSTADASVRAILKEAERLILAKTGLLNAIKELTSELEAYTPWGEIPIDTIAGLRTHGIGIHLFSGSVGLYRQFDFGQHQVIALTKTGNTQRFILVTFKSDAPVWPFQKHAIPGRGIAEMHAELSALKRQLAEGEATLATMAARTPQIREHIATQRTRLEFEAAKQALARHESGTFFYLTGFFPEKQLAKMRNFLESEKLAYTIDDPPAGAAVPVALRNMRLFRFFEPITRIFSLPAYGELDPTPLFAPFFTLFFGFCLGDVGYGLLLLALAVSALFSARLRGVAPLGIILSLATILSGLLMNSFFGATIFGQGRDAMIAADANPAIFAAYTVKGKTVFPAMPLSLVLGAIQVLVAFCFQAVNEGLLQGLRYIWKSLGMLCLVTGSAVIAVHKDFLSLGFNSTFAVGPLQIGAGISAIPSGAGVTILFAGIIAFFLFGNPDRKFFLRPLAALWDFYQFCTGILGDLLSYIRLFALALAGGLLGNAFNQIAFMVLPKNDGAIDYASPWIIATIVILLVGHGLNFALGILGAFVHPLRLTFVEFYKNINFRGGGRAYNPFRRHTRQSKHEQRRGYRAANLNADTIPRTT